MHAINTCTITWQCMPINYLNRYSANITHELGHWTDAIDRGGLIHISDDLFQFFCSVEQVLRSHLHVKCASETEGIREKVIKEVLESEEVIYSWSLVSTNWEAEEALVLMEMMVQQLVVIRGFSYASAFMEKYKQKSKKTVQKSKGLRKTLSNTDNASEASTSTSS